jgi:hypothetical protein
MKKVKPVLIIIAALGVSSCEKTYTCVCTLGAYGNTTYPTIKASNTTDAETRCEHLYPIANACSLDR